MKRTCSDSWSPQSTEKDSKVQASDFTPPQLASTERQIRKVTRQLSETSLEGVRDPDLNDTLEDLDKFSYKTPPQDPTAQGTSNTSFAARKSPLELTDENFPKLDTNLSPTSSQQRTKLTTGNMDLKTLFEKNG